MIAPQLASFLEEGVGIHLGTRNSRLEPNGTRAVAVKVDDAGRHLAVYVPAVSAERVLPDLQANGQGAVLFGRPVDDRSVQVKGVFVDVRDGRDDERELVATQWDGYLHNLGLIGIPHEIYARWPTWPVVVVRLQVTALFEQTPGPGAGAPMP
jgi:hypothetical protein